MKAFIQDWGTYTNETVVCVGGTWSEIEAWMRKNKVSEETIEDFKDEVKTGIRDNLDFLVHNEGRTLLYLRSFKDTWQDYDIILHELHHAVHVVLARNRRMEEEIEALAYQQEYLFREIRRKLGGYEKKTRPRRKR